MASKVRRREQASKIVRSRSKETMVFQLQGRGGTHTASTDYRRNPKHGGWDE